MAKSIHSIAVCALAALFLLALALAFAMPHPQVAYAAGSGDGKPMYRLYNPYTGEHFYTADEAERDHVAGVGWNYEGIGWVAPTSSSAPVYRLYNAYGGEHHYTTDASEQAMLVKAGWNDEGVGWHSDQSRGVRVYREYNPNAFSCNHNYTTSRSEHDYLVSLGWVDEGTAWFGMQLGESAKASIALKSLNGWWQSGGEAGSRWCHIVDGVMYTYKSDFKDGMPTWVFHHMRTDSFSVSPFTAGSSRVGTAGGWQVKVHNSYNSSYLNFDDNPCSLIYSELNGKHYSGSSSYLRNFNPPAGLLSVAKQTE